MEKNAVIVHLFILCKNGAADLCRKAIAVYIGAERQVYDLLKNVHPFLN